MSAAQWMSVAKKADELEKNGNVSEGTAYLLAEYEKGVRHPEILWRTCRALYRSAQETTKPEVRGPLMKSALGMCNASLKAQPDSPDSNLWTGIVLGKQDVSAKQRVANALVIRDHFAKVLKARPHDALALHSMGAWCYTVMGVGWAERKVAAMLFGEPPTSTPSECLGYLLRSSKEGDTVQNAVMVGDVYAKYNKDKPTAKEWYRRAMAMPVNTSAQKRLRDEAEKKFKEL